MKYKPKNRWQAFMVHLLCSIVILSLLVCVIRFFWYPGFLFWADGGLQGLKLITVVDITTGPFLTLLVYKIDKKSLVFDLSCIVILQLSCLAGGMWAVGSTRPAAVVYAAGGYATVNVRGYHEEKYQTEKIPLLKQHWPVWIGVSLPEDQSTAIQNLWSVMGESLYYNVDNYVPYEKIVPLLEHAGKEISLIEGSTAKMKEFQQSCTTCRFFPMTTSLYIGYAGVDPATGKVLEFFRTD
jgi:hypothetical protein